MSWMPGDHVPFAESGLTAVPDVDIPPDAMATIAALLADRSRLIGEPRRVYDELRLAGTPIPADVVEAAMHQLSGGTR